MEEGPKTGVFPDGTTVELTADKDPREVFADWLISPKNPWFAQCICNRVWFWLLGRGIIHEPDDIRDDNPPSNPKLLSILEKELLLGPLRLEGAVSGDLEFQDLSAFFDSAVGSRRRRRSTSRYYPLRRLDAEVLVDALCQITGTTEEYSSRDSGTVHVRAGASPFDCPG